MSVIDQFEEKFRKRQKSYLMVVILTMLDYSLPEGIIDFNEFIEHFKSYYRDRIEKGKKPETDDSIVSRREPVTNAKVKSLLLSNPIPRLNDFLFYDKEKNVLKLKENVLRELNQEDNVKKLRRTIFKNLYDYYKDLGSIQLTIKDLEDLPLEYGVSATDVSLLSRQNRVKGIHPINKNEFKGIILLCTLGGEHYPNQWLDEGKNMLKYYLEGRTDSQGRRTYNLNLSSNKSIIDSREEGYPILVFIRERSGELFHFAGEFSYQRVEEDENGDKYFVLKRIEKMGLPDVNRDIILEAMNRFDQELRDTPEWQGWEDRGAQKYAILHEGKHYPPKQIISMATGVFRSQFSGGQQSNSYLERRGFQIITLEAEEDQEEQEAANPQEVMAQVINHIKSRGFFYPEEFLKNFMLSLKTKPFIILAGISGTGKSKLVELFAEAVGANNENGRYRLIPVRPDWTDSTDLLGYKNLQGKFVEGPLTQVIEKARQDPGYPYFICLDEMNLARVEYYFSDFLSIIESRKKVDGTIISSSLEFHGEIIDFPENLYVIGTVNMDETTHSFSRKVLDRANTMEFSEIALSEFPGQASQEELEYIKNRFFMSEYITLKDCYAGNEDFIKDKVTLLEEINKILEPGGFQVGYRVRDEFCFYLLYNRDWGLLQEKKAVDFQITQKILPRIHGSSMDIEDILNELKEYCGNSYPMSTSKIAFMLRRFTRDGFTSFWA